VSYISDVERAGGHQKERGVFKSSPFGRKEKEGHYAIGSRMEVYRVEKKGGSETSR